MTITANATLTSLAGLESLTSVATDVKLQSNPSLAVCRSLRALLDDVDDFPDGPGPGVAGILDVGAGVIISYNAEGCNSIEEIFAPLSEVIHDNGFEVPQNTG